MKSTNCDAVGLTPDLYACLVELKTACPLPERVEQLFLLALPVHESSLSDEQILALP